MSVEMTRREALLAIGGGLALPVAAPVGASTGQDACGDQRALEREVAQLREQVAAAHADLERLPDEIVERQRRILELFAATSEPRFRTSTRRQAVDIGTRARESVIVLDVVDRYGGGTATAWFVTEHRLLTNAHNVSGAFERIHGVALDGQSFEASVVESVEQQQPDVALLETEYTGTPLPSGDSATLSRDDPVVQVGHPADFGFWVLTLGGYLEQRSADELWATIPGLEGNSGSPILDLDGAVVGMTYGGEPVTEFKTEPGDDRVHLGTLAVDPFTSAVPIQTALELVEAWT